MAKLLRKVQHKTDWDPHGEFSQYLLPGHAPADALRDLATNDNMLSVWQIDEKASNLERVLAAIVSPNDHLQKLDYLMFDQQHVHTLNLTIEQAEGDTCDSQANASWHFHLTHLSATDLANLANEMFTHGEIWRQKERVLASLLSKSVRDGFIEEGKLLPKVRAKLTDL
jgi:hypothetical protein